MTKIVDIRTKTADELSGLLIDLRKELVRRDIARVKTVLVERTRSAAKA
jgi:large subunit ribosomal protein L29